MPQHNETLFGTDNPDIDEEIPAVGDLDHDELERLQTEYDIVKAANTAAKRKCTRLWKSIVPHIDENTKNFKVTLSEAEKASSIEHMHAIRQLVADVNQRFLDVIDSPVVSNADVGIYDTWLGAWKDRLNTIVVPILEPESVPHPPRHTTSSPDHIHTPNTAVDRQNDSILQQNVVVRPKTSLPRLKLRSFDGDFSQYPVFKAVFMSLMEDADASELQQACYLLDSLVKGSEPEKTVRFIDPVRPGALTEMWERLDHKYDNTPLGESVYLQRLMDVAHWDPCQTDETLKKLYEHLFENLHCLRKATGRRDDGDAVKAHIFRLLPDRLKRKITDLTLSEGTYSIDQVMDIMNKQVIHNDRNSHMGGILNPQKVVPTKPKRQTYNTVANECSSPMPNVESSFPPNPSQFSPGCTQCPCALRATATPFYPASNEAQAQSCDAVNNYAKFNKGSSQSWKKPNSKPNAFNSNPNQPNSRPVQPIRESSQPNLFADSQPIQLSPPVRNPCVFCDKIDHESFDCRTHSNLDVYLDIVYQKHLCRNCLRTGHIAAYCQSPNKCDFQCGDRLKHCKQLCKKLRNGTVGAFTVSMVMQSRVHFPTPIYMQTACATISNLDSGRQRRVRFLLDGGSNRSWIGEKMAEQLGLKVLGEFTCEMSTFSHEVETVLCKVVEFAVWIFNPDTRSFEQSKLTMMTNPQMCGVMEGIPLDGRVKSSLDRRDCELADPEILNGSPFSIDILLGLDYYYEFVNPSYKRISEGLVLLSTRFGDVLAGPSLVKQSSSMQKTLFTHMRRCISNHVFLKSHEEEFMISPEGEEDCMRLLTDVETLGILPPNKERSPVLERFEQEVEFVEDEEQVDGFVKGRYKTKLPFIETLKERLPTDFKVSFSRLNSCHKKLSRLGNEENRLRYVTIVEDQLKAGVVKEVAYVGKVDEIEQNLKRSPHYYDSQFVDVTGAKAHYIPHHGVQHPNKKLRMVFDGSVKPYKKAVSLNDCLEKGPSLINSLAAILLRFRLHPCAIVADIEKAFLMISIELIDQEALRFLWRKGDDVFIYRFQRLPFGLRSSPFILAATLKHHLEHSDIDPLLVTRILDLFYVDDWVASFKSREEGLELLRLAIQYLKQAGFNLCKINSNDICVKEVLATGEGPPDVESLLGMVWNTREDTLGVAIDRIQYKIQQKIEQGREDTKQELFSVMQTLFNPLGELSPFVLVAKLLMQKTCKAKLDWKDKLPDDILHDWQAWKSSLSCLPQFKQPRWFCVPDPISYTLCGFCDASSLAYAAVIYLVTSNGREIRSSFVISKSHVAPPHGYSIPRMELCSALLLTHLMAAAVDMLKGIEVEKTVYYTDCMSVLHWIKSAHYSWGDFVANRIKQILSLSNSSNWNYVNTSENPADLPSRGCLLEQLIDNRFWKEGPRFLVTGERPYQGKMSLDPGDMPDALYEELRRCTVSFVRVKPCGLASCGPYEVTNNYQRLMNITINYCGLVGCIPYDRTNSYQRLMNITRQVNDAVFAFKTSKNGKVDWSSRKELPPERVELQWVRSVQQLHFGKEISFCRSHMKSRKVVMGEQVPSSLVRTLGLFWDIDMQVLRCDTRLSESSLSSNQVYPILLPSDSKFTKMLILDIHDRIGHAGVRHTLASLKAEFHVPRGRKLITSLLRGCFRCRKAQAKAFNVPPPPPLPKCRVEESKPFLHVGLDFAGPFHLKGRNKKAYCLLFTCAVVRAVHFEAVQSLSVTGFWMGLRRFICRRGVPSTLISDNFSTFKCVARELKMLLSNKKFQDYLKGRRIQWQFYTERAPWQGGFIERVVGLFKANVRKVIGSTTLDYEEFLTFVCEAELIINSRPLTYVYDSPEGEGPLTPSMLIAGYNLVDLPPLDGFKIDRRLPLIASDRLKYINTLIQAFWSRFHKEYLGELSERSFGKHNKGDVKRTPMVGDIVLVKGERLPRKRWKIGVVIEACANNRDKKVRTVVVRIMGGASGDKPTELRRSPCFLVPLEDTVDQL